MNHPDDYQESALSVLMGHTGTAEEAQVYATLALASAVNRLADAHIQMVDASTELASGR